MIDYGMTPRGISSRLQEALGLEYDPRKSTAWLSLPVGFSIAPIFAFNGAAWRFLIRKDSNPAKDISVYFDVKDQLGVMNRPYYEAYPIEGDTERWIVGEETQMIEKICAELKRLENKED